jgi:hypothetical protein
MQIYTLTLPISGSLREFTVAKVHGLMMFERGLLRVPPAPEPSQIAIIPKKLLSV